MNNNKNNSEKKMLPVSNGLNGAKRLRKGLLAGIFVLLLIVGVSGLQAQLCMSTSFYNNLSWTWSYAGPCSSTYNCLSYSLGITSSWTWPWGYSNPTDSQVTSYLSGRGYYTTGDSAKIISYGTS
ncbi:MAG: hypothetical protein GY765_13415, partial [bacterium]|nr:hypothetical protein [bacterium]